MEAHPFVTFVRFSVRLRSLSAVSIAAMAALLLSGCSGDAGQAPTPVTTGDAALCAAQAAPGAASSSVEVEGNVGESVTATFPTPLEITELEVSPVTTGEGDPIAAGDFVSYTFTVFDPATGEQRLSVGFEPGQVLPTQVSADSVFGQVFGCSTVGSRVVAAFPASSSAASELYVLDLLGVVPDAAWGEPQEPVDGMPTVTVDDDGTPTIEVPDTDPPAQTQIATLKKGDGYQVQSGDTVLIQFRGARWSTGDLFDGGDTWAGGSPYTAQTTGFIPGFTRALEGQTVGSQVLVVITPADGYGEGDINETDLTGETLVFVIDILGAQAATSG